MREEIAFRTRVHKQKQISATGRSNFAGGVAPRIRWYGLTENSRGIDREICRERKERSDAKLRVCQGYMRFVSVQKRSWYIFSSQLLFLDSLVWSLKGSVECYIIWDINVYSLLIKSLLTTEECLLISRR